MAFDLHRRILKGVFLVTAFVAFGKLMAVGKDIGFAQRFGVSGRYDVYLLAIVVVTWAPLVISSIAQSVLVPAISKLNNNLRKRFHSELITWTSVVGVIFTVFVYLYASQLTRLFSSQLGVEAQSELIVLIRGMSSVSFLTCLIAIYSSELLARENHVNTLYEAIPSFILVIALFFHSSISDSLSVLIWVTVFGLMLQAAALVFHTNIQYVSTRINFSVTSPAWVDVRNGFSILLIGSVALSFVSPIDQYFAASHGEGGVSTFGFANRLLVVGVGLAVTVISRALLPILCDANISSARRKKIAVQWCIFSFLCACVSIAIVYPIVDDVVRLIYERGKFTSENTREVSRLVIIGLTQLPSLFAGMVLVQYFVSCQRYFIIAISGCIGVFVKFISAAILIDEYALSGLMISTSLMWLSTFLYFGVVMFSGRFDE